MVICPGSSLRDVELVGAPSARARSDGFQDEMKGTRANAAPTAPVATVAVVRNLRRLVSTSSSRDDRIIRHRVDSPAASVRPARASTRRALEAHGIAVSGSAGGGALYTNENALPGARYDRDRCR